MALLDGFEVIQLKEKIEDVYLTITAKSLKFTRSNARAFELPKYIRILLHAESRQIAIIPVAEGTENSIPFTFEETKREQPIQVKEPAILKAIHRIRFAEEERVFLIGRVLSTFAPQGYAKQSDIEKYQLVHKE